MQILAFTSHFGNNEQCKEHFREVREKSGISCKKCTGTKHYWLKNKEQWQCSHCNFRTTLRSGTIMEDSKLDFLTWYQAMCFISFSKKSISAKEVQRQFGKKDYKSTWLLLHKIREAMGNRDNSYMLKDFVELDDSYFAIETTSKERVKQKKGRGTVTHAIVTVIAESIPLEDIDTGEKSSQFGYVKMKVTPSQKALEVEEIIDTALENKTIVFTDKSTSYTGIEKYAENHYSQKSSSITTKTTLKWVHTAISNAKRLFNGIYHKINGKYLQNYLDEFCYKLNRRTFGINLFDRLVIAVSQNLLVN